MALNPQHEIYTRRFGRNLGLGLVLAGFVALVFALTVVKLTRGEQLQGYDHVVQPALVPAEGADQ